MYKKNHNYCYSVGSGQFKDTTTYLRNQYYDKKFTQGLNSHKLAPNMLCRYLTICE